MHLIFSSFGLRREAMEEFSVLDIKNMNVRNEEGDNIFFWVL